MTNLQNNTEIELSEDTDFFNTLEKAKLIKGFIDSYTPHMINNKIMALFGEWGSGKSSVLKYIQKKLDTNIFSTIYFNSWEYEKDQSLALSLFDALYSESEKKNVKLVGLREQAFRVLGGIAKGFTINLPFGTFNTKDMLEHIENTEKNSYYGEVNNFKNSFIDLENAILGKGTNKRLIVFLDDLDRCEPENILNLLSAIKLFFTYGSTRIMFVCGVDKEAVHKALLIKYNDVIKANEYLEKIFDFSFNMPDSFDIEKALRVSLQEFKNDSSEYQSIIKNISEMFKAIDFTNPRHIKKVINKYIIFRYFSKNQDLGTEYDILKNLKFEKENVFFLLVFFYLIVLYEFDKEAYKNMEFNTKKLDNLRNMHIEGKMELTRINGKAGAGDKGAICSWIDKIGEEIIREMAILKKSSNTNIQEKAKIILNFLPRMESPFIFSEDSNELLKELKCIANKREYKFINYIYYKYNDWINFEFSLKNLKAIIDKLS